MATGPSIVLTVGAEAAVGLLRVGRASPAPRGRGAPGTGFLGAKPSTEAGAGDGTPPASPRSDGAADSP